MTITGATPENDNADDEFKSDETALSPEDQGGETPIGGKKPHGFANLSSSGDSR